MTAGACSPGGDFWALEAIPSVDGGANQGQRRPRAAEIAEDGVSFAERSEVRLRVNRPAEGNEITVADVATEQKGAISRGQLRDLGLLGGAIDRRAVNGQLHRQFRGVYIVGHEALAPLARESAALLAVGTGAILSHESAAVAWAIIEGYAGDVHVTVIDRKLRSRPGLRIHRSSTTPRTRHRHGLLVTSPAQTLIDLSATQSPYLEHAFIESHGLRLVGRDELTRAIERAGPRRGVRALRALIGAYESGFTRSKAERILRALLRAGNLREPLFNALICGYKVDCVWPDHRLVVEFDGERFHGHRRAFETDRRRDATLVAAGYAVIRITWVRLMTEPYAVLAEIAAALARRDPH
jgi:very-short-patch-repair endonuclease